MNANPPPLHMDRWSRTERLYQYLLGLGLIVNPFYSADGSGRIEYLQVSVDLAPFQHCDKTVDVTVVEFPSARVGPNV